MIVSATWPGLFPFLRKTYLKCFYHCSLTSVCNFCQLKLYYGGPVESLNRLLNTQDKIYAKAPNESFI